MLVVLGLAGGRVHGATLRFDPKAAALYLRESEDVPEQLLGTFRFVTRRAGAGDEAQLARAVASDESSCRLVGVDDLGFVGLHAQKTDGGLRVSVDLTALNRRGGLFRPVIELVRAKSDLQVTDGGTKSRGSRSASQADLGTVLLAAEFDPSDIARTMVAPNAHTIISWRWHSKVVESVPAAPFVFDFRVAERPLAEVAGVFAARLSVRLNELDARLQAWNSLLAGEARAAAAPVQAARDTFAQALETFRAGTWSALAPLKERYGRLNDELGGVEQRFVSLRDARKAELQATTRERLAAMPYRVGLAFDGDPAGQFEEWALFRMGLFRLAVNPVWHAGKDRAQRTAIVQRALEEAGRYGMRSVLSVYEEKTAQGAADLTFTNEFVPALRSGFHEFGFNSAQMRDRNLADFDYWLGATRRFDNIESYKVDNEPFWSTQAYPVFGYDQATVGCSPETFVRAVQTRYAEFAGWRKALAGSVGETVLHWQNWSDMRLAPGEARGLTFVDFLRNQYGTLARLNAAWGRDYRDWSEVFPPLPRRVEGRVADDSGAPEFDLGGYRPPNADRPRPEERDIIAWRDWVRFWPHDINDELREFVKLARDRGVTVPVGTNCVGGSTINNAGDLVVSNAMVPWITPDGLGMVAIDFYQPGYLQGYIRGVVGAAQGRPAEVHETGGSDSKDEAWFMSTYSFAYGARGVLFWRRDHTVPATSALGVAEAIDLMQDADLMDRSKPVTDGVAIVYPLETLYGEEARTGTSTVTLGNVQGALVFAKRQQLQYDFVADRDLASALTSGSTRCVVFPAASWVAEAQFTALEQFLARGGAAILPADFGVRDEHGRTRDPARLARIKSDKNVLTLPETAFFELRKTVRAAERSMQFGLAGNSTKWEAEAAKFLDARLAAPVRLRSAEGKLLRTNLALRKSPQATYVFIDPWTPQGFVESDAKVTSATDLSTGRSLAIARTPNGVRIAIPRAATIVRLAN